MVIGRDGAMNDEAGDLAGLTQEEAGERILAWAKERGLLEKRESYRHSVALCERCESRIEPLISLQWWCSMDELKKPALAALASAASLPPGVAAPVRDRLARERARLEHLAPALVGPPAPVWYCPDGHVTVAETEPEACAECGSTSCAATRTCSTPGSRPRSGRSRRSAGPTTRRPRAVLPGDSEHDRARDHPPLGEPDDLLRPRAHGRRSRSAT
jgi:valyl-tRNA synthetase